MSNIIIILAFLFMLFSGYLWRQRSRAYGSWQQVEGLVIGYDSSGSSMTDSSGQSFNDSRVSNFNVVGFEIEGTKYNFVSKGASHKLNDAVSVKYNPEDFSQAEVDDFVTMYIHPIVTSGLAIAGFIVGFGLKLL